MFKTETEIESTLHNITVIKSKVKDYLVKYGNHYIQSYTNLTNEDIDHIINTGTSIMCTRCEIGFPGGGFVQAIVDNDLRGSYAAADSTNALAIRFYVMMIYNVSLEGIKI